MAKEILVSIDKRKLKMDVQVDINTGNQNSLECVFSFDKEWDGLTKTAIFKDGNGKPWPTLITNDLCLVPHEVTDSGTYFELGIFGARDGNIVMTTGLCATELRPGCYTAIAPPSEDIYLQILNEFSSSTAKVEAAADKVQTSADEIQASLPAIHTDAETAKAKAAEATAAAGEAAQSRDKAKEYQDAAQESAADALASAQAAGEAEDNVTAMQSNVQQMAGEVAADKADVASKAQTVTSLAQQVQETANEFPAVADTAKNAVTAEGTKQIEAVNAAGATQTANAKAQADRAQQEADRAEQEADRAASIDAYTKAEIDTIMVPMLIKCYGIREAMHQFVTANASGDGEDLSPIVGRFFQVTASTIGETYTTQFYKYSADTSTEGIKLDDNAGLTCAPSTIATAGTDDYANLPLFACFDCNYTIDADTLEPVIHAIKDVYGEFTSTPTDSFVGVLQMTGWVRRTSGETTKTVEYKAQRADGFEPLPEAVRVLDNTVRSFVIHAKYAAGYNSAGLLSSVSGVQPATLRPGSASSTSISHNGQIAKWREWGLQYCGSSLCDIAFVQLMLEIKYAVLGSAQVMQGCRSYSTDTYQAAVSESGVTRVLLTAANAAFFVAGSCVSLGTGNNRAAAACYDICDISKIASIEDVTVDDVAYKAINLDTETTFNTTTDTYIIPQPWRTGSTDDVPGNDGSPYSNTSGKEPFKIQGIELMLGMSEVPADTTLYEDTEKYTVYANRKASEIASDGSGTNPVTVGTIRKETDAGWKSIAELNWDANNQEAYMLAREMGGSPTTGYRARVYLDAAATTGWREWPAFGGLTGGSSGGFACAGLYAGIGTVGWDSGARACGTGGNRGGFTSAYEEDMTT